MCRTRGGPICAGTPNTAPNTAPNTGSSDWKVEVGIRGTVIKIGRSRSEFVRLSSSLIRANDQQRERHRETQREIQRDRDLPAFSRTQRSAEHAFIISDEQGVQPNTRSPNTERRAHRTRAHGTLGYTRFVFSEDARLLATWPFGPPDSEEGMPLRWYRIYKMIYIYIYIYIL